MIYHTHNHLLYISTLVASAVWLAKIRSLSLCPIEELYDDVDSASLILKGKVEQMDPKMKKKFEKEEKEFRKKFHVSFPTVARS